VPSSVAVNHIENTKTVEMQALHEVDDKLDVCRHCLHTDSVSVIGVDIVYRE